MPFSGFPGVDGTDGNHAAFTVDDRLEGPADRRVVFVEDCFRGFLDLGRGVAAEGGDETFFGNRVAAKLDEELFELRFV
tara:strand:+ start:490 stop:726 length:237 start_codon:yes stop_codon:yes gene_type:complete